MATRSVSDPQPTSARSSSAARLVGDSGVSSVAHSQGRQNGFALSSNACLPVSPTSASCLSSSSLRVRRVRRRIAQTASKADRRPHCTVQCSARRPAGSMFALSRQGVVERGGCVNICETPRDVMPSPDGRGGESVPIGLPWPRPSEPRRSRHERPAVSRHQFIVLLALGRVAPASADISRGNVVLRPGARRRDYAGSPTGTCRLDPACQTVEQVLMAGDMPVGATPPGFRDRGIEAREETCAVRGCRFDSGNARECGTGHGLSPFVRWPIQCREFPVRQKTPVFGAVFHLRPRVRSTPILRIWALVRRH
jgi:hypothetical protein